MWSMGSKQRKEFCMRASLLLEMPACIVLFLYRIVAFFRAQPKCHFVRHSTLAVIAYYHFFPTNKPIRAAKSKGEKERYIHLNAEFQRIARRDKKAILGDQCKEIEENNKM